MSQAELITSVDYCPQRQALAILDQTQLPNKEVVLYLTGVDEIREAIYLLKVRGAPAIGIAAAIGIAVVMKQHTELNPDAFIAHFYKAKEILQSARPTAVNLAWALEQIGQTLQEQAEQIPSVLAERLLQKALEMREEDIAVCKAIGEHGLRLLRPGAGLLTHCNAGQLATIRYGTATAPMYLGHEQGYDFHIYCDETRPLLQGARLTTFELARAGLDVTLLCDNMAASLMKQGKVDAVLVGCDRVAANGDTANKIGTLNVAILAREFGIPFYVCAPSSTVDFETLNGKGIVIEQRPDYEVTDLWYEHAMAPQGINVYNPAFDVTDHSMITAFITEKGLVYPPYDVNLRKVLSGQKEETM